MVLPEDQIQAIQVVSTISNTTESTGGQTRKRNEHDNGNNEMPRTNVDDADMKL